jgi:hypothetical protein
MRININALYLENFREIFLKKKFPRKFSGLITDQY